MIREKDFSSDLSNAWIYLGEKTFPVWLSKYALGEPSFIVQPQKGAFDLCVSRRAQFKAQYPGRTWRFLLKGAYLWVGQAFGYFQHKGTRMGSTVNSATNLWGDQLRTGQSLGQLRRYSSQPQAAETGFSERFLAVLCLAKWSETGDWAAPGRGGLGHPLPWVLSCFPQQLNKCSCLKRTCSILRQDEGWADSEAGLDVGGISSCCGTDYRKLQKGCGGVMLALPPTASAERKRERLLEGCAGNLSYASTARHTARLAQLLPPKWGAIGNATKTGTIPFSRSHCSHRPGTAASPRLASLTASGLPVTSKCWWDQQQSHASLFSARAQWHELQVWDAFAFLVVDPHTGSNGKKSGKKDTGKEIVCYYYQFVLAQNNTKLFAS